MLSHWLLLLVLILNPLSEKTGEGVGDQFKEQHRPQFHFSPPSMWMNDPNGMVYLDGEYHLFYQHHPHTKVWGPMHWGHAVSRDLVTWEHLPIALYPDSLGYIFSGSGIIDKTSSFGDEALVAVYTYHDPVRKEEGRSDFQYQGVAYSTDNGRTFSKYINNPVLENPGIPDFRDPKVIWLEDKAKYIMALSVDKRIHFYSSPDLKNWTFESEFGEGLGSHEGTWECPDLFTLNLDGKKYWILLVSLNAGGPNKGSATQYFIGDFDGKTFIVDSNSNALPLWLDYGTDNYAGVTWSNTGDDRIFIGWMSNWMYANAVPTHPWRSAMTSSRKLHLKESNGKVYLCSQPVDAFRNLRRKQLSLTSSKTATIFEVKNPEADSLFEIHLSVAELATLEVKLENNSGDVLRFGFDPVANRYYLDRENSGIVDFSKHFPATQFAPRLINSKGSNIKILLDTSSIEIFADEGLTVMSAIVFPNQPYKKITISSGSKLKNNEATVYALNSIW